MAQRREGSRPRDPRFLEGSRFVSWQPFRIAAGGSRELPSVCHAGRMRLAKPLIRKAALELLSSGAVLGSRLLPTYRAANLQSGSPPGLGRLVRAKRLQTLPGSFLTQLPQLPQTSPDRCRFLGFRTFQKRRDLTSILRIEHCQPM